jgi:hypothetical protein
MQCLFFYLFISISISFFFYKLKAEAHGNSWMIDPSNAYFVLNPEDNLPNTQKIFQNWFER